ncbi:tetratricopeptide repeat protein [Almyronema epifaneia]|uniref:Tetratricopeptide repeat protein n=1 Tax=Almyronema epifaneia S1 TaxID=2991925 RepID=A0ABW6IBF5_9CYAN
MTQSVDTLFDEGIKRYQSGESAKDLIPIFKEICDRTPKNSAAWTCLAWLYLLADKPNSALKAAQKGVKLAPQDPQARINLSIAMLEAGKPGVRSHVELAGRAVSAIPEIRQEVESNFEEGLSRKPDWPSLQRVKNWLFES